MRELARAAPAAAPGASGRAPSGADASPEAQRRDFPAVSAFVPSFETAARSLKVTPITAPVRSDVEIETAIVALGREPGGGLVAMSDAFMVARRAPIIVAAARNNVPVVYLQSEFVRDGGLLSYGANREDPSAISVTVEVLTASTSGEIDTVFARLANEKHTHGLLVSATPLFSLNAFNWPSWRRAMRSLRSILSESKPRLADY
jgi:hypothetical protein